MLDAIPEHNNREFWLWLLRRRRRMRVVEESMVPTLLAGDEILFDPRAYDRIRPKPGDVVVAYHPDHPELKLVKRVLTVHEDGRCELTSDNPDVGIDSRHFGPVSAELILGRVTSRFG